MGKLINLAVYNPAILNDDEFLEGFVARRELTQRLLKRLGDITPKNVARHLLLIGQRGMGKTSMLRRLALGISSDPDLSAVLIPLTFREEQYNVHNLHVFWCNCLDALADHFEKHGQRDRAAQLDNEIGKLASKGSDPDGAAACALFKAWCAEEGKRPLLLIDNIDLIFGGLKEQHQWGLRRILQLKGGVAVVGASAGFMEAATRVEAPFYDFFQVHQLEKLGHQEILSCLRQIAIKRGESGIGVLKILDTDPARIQTLYDLTGGNPRTLVLLYLLLEMNPEGDVMDDLERLLDQVTALYKARVEDLAPQTRVMLDAIALAWNPVTVAQIATETGIESTSVSSQFDRLLKMGILERVSLSKPAPVGYQLGERFFNIWYLMRNASRRMRNRLRWLTEFLRRLYTPQQLSLLADDFIRRSKEKGRCSGVYGLALADALEDSDLRHAMNHHVTRLFQEQATALCEQVEKFVDRNDLDQTTLTMAEAKQQILSCRRDWGNTSAEEFWDLIGGSTILSSDMKYSIASRLLDVEVEQIESIVESHKHFNETLKQDSSLTSAFDCLRDALRDGMLDSRNDFTHALAAAKEYDCPELPLIMINVSANADLVLEPEVRESVTDALRALFKESGKKFNNNCYYAWGRFLIFNNFPDEAEGALRHSIELDPKSVAAAVPLTALGALLTTMSDRSNEAEQAYHTAITLNPQLASSRALLGGLLHYRLKRYEEAEAAYRKAIELNSNDAKLWYNLGNLLPNLDRFDESEQAYRHSIQIDPSDPNAWNALGNLLQDHLNQYLDAEEAYKSALKLDTNYVYPRANLAYLLLAQPERIKEAEIAYTEAIQLLPEHGRQLLISFRALTRDNFGEAKESLAVALEQNHSELFTMYFDDLIRLLRLARVRGYGERLIAFLQESGLGDRHWPLYTAFDAFLYGEERLRDVNPEVRSAAQHIYNWLSATPHARKEAKETSPKVSKRKTRSTAR